MKTTIVEESRALAANQQFIMDQLAQPQHQLAIRKLGDKLVQVMRDVLTLPLAELEGGQLVLAQGPRTASLVRQRMEDEVHLMVLTRAAALVLQSAGTQLPYPAEALAQRAEVMCENIRAAAAASPDQPNTLQGVGALTPRGTVQ